MIVIATIITAMRSPSAEIARSLGVACFTVTGAILLSVLRYSGKLVLMLYLGKGKLCPGEAADFMTCRNRAKMSAWLTGEKQYWVCTLEACACHYICYYVTAVIQKAN